MKTSGNIFAVFQRKVNEESAQALIDKLTEASKSPLVKRIHLMFQSSGGHPGEAINIFNFLEKYPKPLSIYNIGCVQSAATIAFLAPRIRVANPYATFMVHRVFYDPKSRVTEEQMRGEVNELTLENKIVETILRKRAGISHARYSHLGAAELWFCAKCALKTGIATRIGDFSPPPGTPLLNFGDAASG